MKIGLKAYNFFFCDYHSCAISLLKNFDLCMIFNYSEYEKLITYVCYFSGFLRHNKIAKNITF